MQKIQEKNCFGVRMKWVNFISIYKILFNRYLQLRYYKPFYFQIFYHHWAINHNIYNKLVPSLSVSLFLPLSLHLFLLFYLEQTIYIEIYIRQFKTAILIQIDVHPTRCNCCVSIPLSPRTVCKIKFKFWRFSLCDMCLCEDV